MLVKFDADEDLVDAVKAFTGHAVASKAFMAAAERAIYLDALCKDKDAHITQLMLEVAHYRGLISSARQAAAMLVERTAQDDLFIDQPSSARQIHSHSF